MQRANADAVTAEENRALREVDKAERELTLQMLENIFAMFFVEMDDDFGIGVGLKNMTLRFERGPLLGKIEQLAIEHDRDRAILVVNWLAAIGQSDNTETAVTEAEARREQIAVSIGTAMHQRVIMRLTVARTGSRLPQRSMMPETPHIKILVLDC